MLDIRALLEEIKASPYEELSVCSPCSGTVEFPEHIFSESSIDGPFGLWKENPGTLLATVNRERNLKPIHSTEKGEIVFINKDLHGQFIEAGTELIKYRHFLSKEEVVERILRQALHLYLAPERAKYYFVPSLDIKIKVSGSQSVMVHDGEEVFIMSRMKRETPIRYSGPDGVIYAVYFSHNENVDLGQPLIGICPPAMLGDIEKVVAQVQAEWKGGN